MSTKKVYTAQAFATGGREGSVTSEDGVLDLKMNLKNDGSSTNPEQLFAAGYAACFESTIQMLSRQQHLTLTETGVNGLVDLQQDENGYGIAVVLEVSLPELDEETAHDLLEKAHQNCPYSKATRNNIPITINLVRKMTSTL